MLPNFESDDDAPQASLAERIDDALLQLDRYRERPLATVLAVCSIGSLLALAWWLARPSEPVPIDELIPNVALVPTSLAPTLSEPLVVHVAGAVQSAGVFTLPAGSRVLDAVDAAGGATAEADLHQLNLAAGLSDGTKIRVPKMGEIGVSEVAGAPLVSDGSSTGEASSAGPVNINLASVAELQTLPGVGPSTAQSIITYRDQYGSFGSADGLLSVAGIGPAKLAGLRESVVVR